MAVSFKPCLVSGCKRNAAHKAGGRRGFCRPHELRDKFYGDPLSGRRINGSTRGWLTDHSTFSHHACLRWPFGYYLNGYPRSGRKYAHQLMCEIVHGPCPPRHEAAHTCGHEWCVNPKHIRWATSEQNSADMVTHGTRLLGEKVASAKLTAKAVATIRSLAGKLTQAEIGARFGVGQDVISRIINRKSWGWLKSPPTT